MAKSDEPKPDETVIRVIIRLPDEMIGDFARLKIDSEDFLRKLEYKSTGRPENGLSILRLEKFSSMHAVWDYIGSKKPMGAAACQFSRLRSKNFKYTLTGENNEHISLRCEDCDLTTFKDGACKPNGFDSFESCPFFGPDPANLAALFTTIEPIEQREIIRRKKKT